MGDTSINTRAEILEQPSQPPPDSNNAQKTSIDKLHEAKPSENISINSAAKETNEETPKIALVEKINETSTKIETVFEKLDANSDKSDSTSDSTVVVEGIKTTASAGKVSVPKMDFDIKEKTPIIDRQKSDIFSLDEVTNSKSSEKIFSVSGTPSGRINRRRDLVSTVFPPGIMGCKDDPVEPVSPRRFLDAKEAKEDFAGHLSNTPRKRSTSARLDRNPVTGVGVDCEDNRRNTTRKRDGNPVLGLGYDPETNSTPSTNRIPPGGYSNGLW